MRMKRTALSILAVVAAASIAAPAPVAASPAPVAASPAAPENLALRADVSANAHYGSAYPPRKINDGRIPNPGGSSDEGQAWAVNGATHRNSTVVRFTWPEPVTVGELVYFGRCASDWNENFKGWRISTSATGKPVAVGELKPGRGPQRMKLPKPVSTRMIRIQFTSAYGGKNPGASEIQVYSKPAPDKLLGEFLATDVRKGRTVRKPAPARPAPKQSPELLGEALAGAMEGVEEIVFAERHNGRDPHWYANFAYYARNDREKAYGPPGGRLVRLNLRTGKTAVVFEDPNGSIRDPQVHYDGKRILFAYRRGGYGHFHLYEIGLDGSRMRQITPDAPYDDYEPTYMPDGAIVFCSSRCKRWVNCWLTQVAVLYRCNADGSNMRAISSNIEHDNTPWPLPDGRVLYMRWEYVDRSQVHYHHLWTVNPDGSAQMVYFGNLRPGVVMIDAKPIIPGPGAPPARTRKIVSLFSPGHGRREHAGDICIVDPDAGPDDNRCVRPVPGGRNVRDPWAFSEHLFLAARGRQIVLLDDRGRSRVLHTSAFADVHEPRPVMKRPRERVISPRVDTSKPTGKLFLSDVNHGRNMAGVAPGEIKKLLILETLPKPINYTGGMDPLSYGGTFTLERVLGTVPVEPDGSAYFEVPAMRSVFFVALDANDLAVKRMQSFVTVQPGETLSCVGCHENRSDVPVAQFGSAVEKPPSTVVPIAGVPDVLDFPRDVQPILDKHCLACHDYRKTARGGPRSGGVILTGDRGPMFSHSYYTLTVAKQFSDGRNLARSNYAPRTLGSAASRILAKVGAPGMMPAGGKTHHGAELSPREIDTIRLWIDSGAAYPGTYAALGSGCIGGYYENRSVHNDFNWPETKAAQKVLTRRCDKCHSDKGRNRLPHAMSDENRLSFWKPSMSDPRLSWSRHIMFNLSRPELSLVLLAPLSPDAGGLGMARRDPKTGQAGEPHVVFESTDDPDYRTLLAWVQAGRKKLDEMGRFDMPTFVPPWPYVREMQRYGVLPKTVKPGDKVDYYAADRAYWKSLWWEEGRK